MAQLRPAFRRLARRTPGAMRLVQLLRRVEHLYTLRFARRANMLYTEFRRMPTQLDVLAGPLLEALGADARDELRIAVFGCSTGAEPYSILSTLKERHPALNARAECFDIEPAVIEQARAATYSLKEVTAGAAFDQRFVDRTFVARDGQFVVKPEIARLATFDVGDVLDAALIRRLGKFDIVVAQNFLFHLDRASAERALDNLTSLLKPTSALLIDGMDLDLRTRMTSAAGLVPFPVELERIHADSLVLRGHAWPNIYWGLEPLDASRPDAERRYATIFVRLRGSAGRRVRPPATAAVPDVARTLQPRDAASHL